MLINELHSVVINRSNIDWYTHKGFVCELKEKIFVNSNDLKTSCARIIKYICDYCLNESSTQYGAYYRNHQKLNKDACYGCRGKKLKDCIIEKYGVENINHIPSIAKKSSKFNRFSYEFVKSVFEERNYILLSKKYNNKRELLKYICPKHGEQETTFERLYKLGHGCAKCGLEKRSGENHHNWKGGVSSLKTYLRSVIEQWKWDSMVNCHFKCIITGDSFDVVHHLYSYSKIIEEGLGQLNLPFYSDISKYSYEEFNKIKAATVELHEKYPLGVCLRDDMHKLFHELYGNNNNTPEQFYEFTDSYIREQAI